MGDLLRERDLPSSAGSWDDLLEKRILPALAKRAITVADLVQFLRESEEYGRQHIFLYKCPPARVEQLIDRDVVRKALAQRGAATVLDHPSIVDWPTTTRIVDARWEAEGESDAFILKIVDPRMYHVLVDEIEQGDFIVKRYIREQVRAVNVLHLHHDGLLEMRIAAHKNTSQYTEDIKKMWRMAEPILAASQFRTFLLDGLKKKLWDNKRTLAGEIAYSNSKLRDQFGNVLTAATGQESASLSDREGVAGSLDVFLEHGGVYETLNVRFLGEAEGVQGGPSQSVRVLLLGTNEFAVTAQCTKSDYDRVIKKIIRLNK